MSVHNNYSMNVFIHPDSDRENSEADNLRKRMQLKPHGKNVPFHEIAFKNRTFIDGLSREDMAVLAQVDNSSRIYLMFHGQPGSDYILDGHKKNHFSKVAEWLSMGLTHKSLKLIDPDTKVQKNLNEKALRISLIVCYGGVGGKSSESSFGSKLHDELGNGYNINSQVVARTKLVYVADPRIPQIYKEFGKLTTNNREQQVSRLLAKIVMNSEHKTAGSKITFSWDKGGDQVVVDSYREAFSGKVLSVLAKLEAQIPDLDPEWVSEEIEELKFLLSDVTAQDSRTIDKVEKVFKEIDLLLRAICPEVKPTLNEFSRTLYEAEMTFSPKSVEAHKTGKSLIRGEDQIRDKVGDETVVDSNIEAISGKILSGLEELKKQIPYLSFILLIQIEELKSLLSDASSLNLMDVVERIGDIDESLEQSPEAQPILNKLKDAATKLLSIDQ